MSTAIKKSLTATQRTAEAARQAGEVLGLDDTKALTAALAEAAVEGVRRNPAFAAHVRTLYEQMQKLPKSPKASAKQTRRSTSQRVAPDVELVPRPGVEVREANPGAAPDAYYLLALYGKEQLPLALARYKLPELKAAAELVQQKNPGTKPTSKGSRDALIAYMVQQVAR